MVEQNEIVPSGMWRMEHNTYFIFVLPLAERKFVTYLEFLALVSESAVMRMQQAYHEALDFIERYPESCPLYSHNPRYRYKLFGGRYRIVFEIVGQAVYAYDIQDCREDIDKSLI